MKKLMIAGLVALSLGVLGAVVPAATLAVQTAQESAQSVSVADDAERRDAQRDAFIASEPETREETVMRYAQDALDEIGATGYTLYVDALWAGDHYGVTNLETGSISINSRTPDDLIYSVVVHEYAHVIQSQRGDTLEDVYESVGGTKEALEEEADHMACDFGATWVHYIGHC